MDVPAATTVLSRWANFYVVIGSGAAALTGLQFVVIALFAEAPQRRPSDGIDAFSTPTIVYFGFSLLVASALCAPWPSLVPLSVFIGIVGAMGTAYSIIASVRAKSFGAYKLVLEDWIWHVILPVASHATILIGGLALLRFTTGALFAVGSASLLLLFIGIHNAWDTVTFMVVKKIEKKTQEADSSGKPAA
jgi:hypothetical protein